MDKKLTALLEGLSAGELNAIKRGILGRRPAPYRLIDHTFSGNHIKFGYYSDPHVGEKNFIEPLWMRMIAYFKREGIETVYCPGDNLEGMSNRPGHIYELSHVGASAQLHYASDLFQVCDKLHFFITDGNHDQWYKEKANSGLISGEELQARNKNVTFLGEWEAFIKLAKGTQLMLFHANDGTAYADSYKIQKLIESLEGGTNKEGKRNKPNIILSGHYHKQVQIYRRNVIGFECGTLCGQTRFMRGKKLPAHKGFGIIEVWISALGGVERLRHEWVPYFD